MRYIKINLNPHSPKDSKVFLMTIEKFFPYTVLVLAGCIVLNVLLFAGGLLSAVPFSRAKKEWEQLAPQAAAISALKKELNALKEKRGQYETLLHRDIIVAHILADMYASMPKNIWVKELSLKDGFLDFTGLTVEWKENYSVSINRFIKQLQKEPYFSGYFKNISLKNQKKQEFSGREIMKFEVECGSEKLTQE